MRLGKRPRRLDRRTLKMARYLTVAGQAPPLQPPSKVDYTHGITDWGMMLNDRLGCCTIAAVGHAVQTWTANALGRELTVPDSAILNYYQQWDGYNPAAPATDQGGVELDVLNHWRKQGFNGESLDAFAAVDVGAGDAGHAARLAAFRKKGSESQGSNSQFPIPQQDNLPSPSPVPESLIPSPACGPQPFGGHRPVSPVPCPESSIPNSGFQIPDIATAIWLFGGVYIGVELPIAAQTQDVWDVPANPGAEDEPGSWGGHAVYLVGYDLVLTQLPIADGRSKELSIADCRLSIENPSHSSTINCQSSIDHRQSTISCITWGQVKKMTWAWFQKYCSEAYALVSRDWLEASGLAPSGFDLAGLEKDLEEVSGARCQVSETETRFQAAGIRC
jgi:hypothetical protein